MFDNWKLLVFLNICATVLWSICGKAATTKMPATMVAPIIASIAAIFVVATTHGTWIASQINWQGIMWASGAGIFGGITSLLLYRAIQIGPLGLVIPLSEMYIVCIPICAWLLFNETISLKQMIGIIVGLIAFVLLATE